MKNNVGASCMEIQNFQNFTSTCKICQESLNIFIFEDFEICVILAMLKLGKLPILVL